jgi:glutamate synthase (NADPH/NADH) large chain
MTGGRVVILGKTGRNFAAGMSGGIAYVFDPEHSLDRLVNKDMVELESLNEVDLTAIKEMIKTHYQFTGSDPADWILENWDKAVELFVKVMPKDYKAVLEKQNKNVIPSEARNPQLVSR